MKQIKPSVVISIVTYNSEKTIAACIESVCKQTYSRIRVQVIDNASSDNTCSLVKKFEVALVRNAHNTGYAKAHNQGIRLSHGSYVLTLNPDVVLDSRFVEHMVRVMNANPQVGSAAGILYRVNSLEEAPSIIDGAGLCMSRSRRQRLRFEAQDHTKTALHQAYIFGPDGAAAFYRRTMLNDIALNGEIFDEDFFMHKEDVDVCWRAQLRGWKSVLVTGARGRHIRTFRAGHRTLIDPRIRRMAVRNRYYLMIKNEIPLLFFRDFIWVALYEIGIFSYIIFRERQSLAAYKDVWDHRAVLLKKRKGIQFHRKVTAAYMAQWFA